MTPRPALGSELPGYLSSLRRGLSTLLGRDGPELAEVGADLRELAGLLGARPAGAPSADPWAGLRADLAALRSTVDRVDLLADRVQHRAARLAGTVPPSRPDGSVEQRLRSAERLLDNVPGTADGAHDLPADEEPAAVPAPDGPAGPTPTGEHLMRVLDRLGGAMDTRPDPDPLLGWLHRQLVDVLDAEGITLIEDDGPFDPARHEIIDTRPTDDPAQADRISATVRPGYQHRESVLRPQQVVVWRAR